MWKKMFKPGVLAFAVMDAVISSIIAWLLVVKLGWRFSLNLLEPTTFDLNTSFVLCASLTGMALPVIGDLALLAFASATSHDRMSSP